MDNLIDLYVKAVGQHLPAKNREDIEKEIRSLIEDTLEDQARTEGRQPDEAMVADVLKRMGPPEKVAASYLPPRYLIGPRLFPHYITTLRIVLSVVLVLAALATGVSLGANATPSSLPDLIAKILSGLLTAAFQAAAAVTLIFAVIEFTQPDLKLNQNPKEWDPRTMKAEPDEERVNAVGTIIHMIVNVIAIVVLNFYPEWIGFWQMRDGVLTPAFFTFLPFITALWSLEIIKDVLLMVWGKWTSSVRWFSLAISVFTIALGGWLLAGPSIVGLDPAVLSKVLGSTLNPETIQTASQALASSVRIVIGIIVVLEVVELGKQIYKLFLRDRVSALAA